MEAFPMAAPSMLLRGLPLLRLRLHFQFHHRRCAVGFITAPSRRSWCTVTADSARSDDKLSSADDSTASLHVKHSPKFPRWDDPDYRRWKDKEEEILSDVDPILSLAKDILHSDRYLDGEQLTVEDEKVVVEKLLAYHPHFEDKIGCGLDSVMVDRHPQFRQSRCLFVIRTDGVWIDFSYQKCLRAYIRVKYPSHAERFIREHFKRSSG